MSGTPKYSSAELEQQRQQQLEEERQRRAAEEAKLRAEAAERERSQRLEKLRKNVDSQQKSITAQIQQQQSAMYSQDAAALIQRSQNQTDPIHQAQNESQLQNVVTELKQILQATEQAITRKRRDDEEKKRKEEIDLLKFELEELEIAVGCVPADDASKFDATGQNAVKQALSAVRSALATGNPQNVKTPINSASSVVKQHIQVVAQRRAEWEKSKAAAEEVVGQIQDLVTGLKADPVVMRWHSHSIVQLENELQQSNQALISEQFEQPSHILAKIMEKEQQIIAEANVAQLKADKRDYITGSIVATLQDMGFSILSIQDEHAGHPSTAKVFTATAASKAISVSVPVEGQVWYDVDGYSKSTVASVTEGHPVAICDEAEAVLTEMHSTLQQEFGVQMGEVSWQGKDPNRIARIQESLPTEARQAKEGNR